MSNVCCQTLRASSDGDRTCTPELSTASKREKNKATGADPTHCIVAEGIGSTLMLQTIMVKVRVSRPALQSAKSTPTLLPVKNIYISSLPF